MRDPTSMIFRSENADGDTVSPVGWLATRKRRAPGSAYVFGIFSPCFFCLFETTLSLKRSKMRDASSFFSCSSHRPTSCPEGGSFLVPSNCSFRAKWKVVPARRLFPAFFPTSFSHVLRAIAISLGFFDVRKIELRARIPLLSPLFKVLSPFRRKRNPPRVTASLPPSARAIYFPLPFFFSALLWVFPVADSFSKKWAALTTAVLFYWLFFIGATELEVAYVENSFPTRRSVAPSLPYFPSFSPWSSLLYLASGAKRRNANVLEGGIPLLFP